jgi:hypothetical protein
MIDDKVQVVNHLKKKEAQALRMMMMMMITMAMIDCDR